MKKEKKAKDVYEDILETLRHYELLEPQKINKFVKSAPIVNPNQYQEIPSIYEKVPVIIGNQT